MMNKTASQNAANFSELKLQIELIQDQCLLLSTDLESVERALAARSPGFENDDNLVDLAARRRLRVLGTLVSDVRVSLENLNELVYADRISHGP